MSHRKAQAAWDLVITLVSSLGGATRTHDWCAWRHRVIMLLPVQAGVIKPINNNTYSLYIAMKLDASLESTILNHLSRGCCIKCLLRKNLISKQLNQLLDRTIKYACLIIMSRALVDTRFLRYLSIPEFGSILDTDFL